MSETFVIVGAGLAGVTAAFSLRDEGFAGNIILISAEHKAPYERPPLSKKYLKGEVSFDDIKLRPENHFAEKNIDLRFGSSVSQIDTQAQTVSLTNSESIHYDKLLIATGTRNRKLKISGADLAGIYDLRNAEDADAIRKEAQAGRQAVLVGMGFIGSEVAATLRQLGVNVTIVEPLPIPFAKSLGEDLGRLLVDIHRERGVVIYLGEGVASLRV